MGNTMFDTNRFIETTSVKQQSSGTIQFMDTQNPGVYYTAHRNGNVNRVHKTNEQHIIHDGTNTTQTFGRCKTRYTRVNYRQPNGTYVKLHRLSDQLGRIQEVADYYNSFDNNVNTTSVIRSNNQSIIITPR